MMLATKLTVKTHSIDQREAGIRPDKDILVRYRAAKRNK